MSRRCGLTACIAPEEVGCKIGESLLESCPHWHPSSEESSPEAEFLQSAGTKLPWTGNAFGASDLTFLTGGARARLIGVMGAAHSGKTSLLGAWYLLLVRGISLETSTFAGSLTLEGWENIAASMRWNSLNGPAFPAHTSSGGGRHPGLLHLALRLASQRLEVLFADAPGEWFTRWAVRRDAVDAVGARWISELADVLVIVADSDALAGPRRGSARSNLLELLRRVGDEKRDRPIALVWTKSDVQVPEEMKVAISTAADRALGEYTTFRVSMRAAPGDEHTNQGQGLIELFKWVTTVAEPAYPEVPIQEPERNLLRIMGGVNG